MPSPHHPCPFGDSCCGRQWWQRHLLGTRWVRCPQEVVGTLQDDLRQVAGADGGWSAGRGLLPRLECPDGLAREGSRSAGAAGPQENRGQVWAEPAQSPASTGGRRVGVGQEGGGWGAGGPARAQAGEAEKATGRPRPCLPVPCCPRGTKSNFRLWLKKRSLIMEGKRFLSSAGDIFTSLHESISKHE